MAMSTMSARDRVLAQFDPAGGGSTIDRAILASVLLELSGAVWTAQHVDTLLASFRKEDVRTISCKEFVDWIFKDSAESRAPSKAQAVAPDEKAAAEEKQPAIDAYTEGLVDSIRSIGTGIDVEGLVQQDGEKRPEDCEALKRDLLEVSRAYVDEAQRRGLTALWDEFSTGTDGAMSLDQCTQLVSAYLRRSANASEELVQALVQLSVKLQATLAKSSHVSADHGGIEALAQERSKALAAQLAPRVKEIMEELCTRDPRAIAIDLMKVLGLPEGGKAQREQIELGLDEALRQVLRDPSARPATA